MKRHYFPNRIKTFGKSMYPLLLDGDIIYLKGTNFTKLLVNDIICVRKHNQVFTHRIVFKDIKYCVTRGDNNTLSDGKIYPHQIIGKIDKFKRNGQIFNIDTIYLLQSTLYLKQIIQVKKVFKRNNIDYIFLKGLPLHLYFEKSHPRRIYSDCDILIDKSKYRKVRTIFKKLGYLEIKNDTLGLKRKHDKYQEVSFYKKVNGSYVQFDIHLEIVFMMTQIDNMEQLYPQKLLDSFTKKLLSEKTVISLFNEEFPILTLDNLFVYLMLHLMHHNMQGGHRYDFLKIIANRKLNLGRVTNIINTYKLNNFVYPPLVILKKYYRVGLPHLFIEQIKPSRSVKSLTNSMQLADILNDQGRFNNGVNRFKNIFNLSPLPIYRKIFIFLDFRIMKILSLIFLLKIKNRVETMRIF